MQLVQKLGDVFFVFIVDIRNIVLLLPVLFFTIMLYGARVSKKIWNTGQQVGFLMAAWSSTSYYHAWQYSYKSVVVMKMNQQCSDRIMFWYILLLLAYIIAFSSWQHKNRLVILRYVLLILSSTYKSCTCLPYIKKFPVKFCI